MEHELKIWPREYEAIVDGFKTHEVRHTADRMFEVNDVLNLREWVSAAPLAQDWPGRYTGRRVRVRVTYVTPGGQWGLPNGVCVLSIALERTRHHECEGC